VAVPYSEYPVDVVRSTRRRKTVQAQVVDGRIRVLVPARLSQAEVDAHVRNLVGRLDRRRRRHTGDVDLEGRAAELCRRFDLPRPQSVRWVTNQRSRWGSCTPSTGEVRISDRLRPWPTFVLDYVLVHELTHLVELHHTPHFHDLVDRYPMAERAKGFLLAQSYGAAGRAPEPADDDGGALDGLDPSEWDDTPDAPPLEG
jgi:predicted metal-dependent hydrolase